jgi:hypothetical protein
MHRVNSRTEQIDQQRRDKESRPERTAWLVRKLNGLVDRGFLEAARRATPEQKPKLERNDIVPASTGATVNDLAAGLG